MRRSVATPALRSTIPFCTSIGAADGVDDAAKLDEPAVSSALDDTAVMNGDGRVDEIAAERPKPREGAVFVRPGQSADSRRRRRPGSRQAFVSRSLRPSWGRENSPNTSPSLPV